MRKSFCIIDPVTGEILHEISDVDLTTPHGRRRFSKQCREVNSHPTKAELADLGAPADFEVAPPPSYRQGGLAHRALFEALASANAVKATAAKERRDGAVPFVPRSDRMGHRSDQTTPALAGKSSHQTVGNNTNATTDVADNCLLTTIVNFKDFRRLDR